MNVGASSETDYGNYYQYGKGAAQYAETRGQSDYSGTENPLDSSVDTAAQVWGGPWHMPTRAQIEELIDKITFQWVKNYKGSGINGALFTAQNGNSVFIPAAGYWDDGNRLSEKTYCFFWSSSPYSYSSDRAVGVQLGNYNTKQIDGIYRKYGISVRPVIG